MEKWKIAVIVALLLSLVGFGLMQQGGSDGGGQTPTPPPTGTPTPSPYDSKTLPAYSFKQWSGTPAPFESLKGKTTFIEIFRIDCPHCQDAAPMMADINRIYGPRGLNQVGIQSPGNFKDASNLENDWPTVKTWVKERGMKYPIAFDEKSGYFQGTLKDKFFGGDGSKLLYPTLIIIGPDGKIIWSQTGHDAAKAVSLAVELENLFPGPGTKEQRAKALVKWLQSQSDLATQLGDPTMAKALADDIATRLK